MGPPDWLIDRVRTHFGVGTFVETGSYRGDTAAWAAQFFAAVHSVEMSLMHYEAALARHGHLANVKFAHGESPAFLADLAPALADDSVFWLDAHWMGGTSHGAHAQCPLLAELAEINRSPRAHFLFIDDARLFLAPPPLPHQAEQWPTITQVIAALAAKDRYVVVVEDVIVAVPARTRHEVMPWVQERATAALRRRKRTSGGWLARLLGRRGDG